MNRSYQPTFFSSIATAGLLILTTGAVMAGSPDPVSTDDTKRTESVPSVRSDAYGDPLPAGATARLGTIRLRQRNKAEGVTFSPDGTRLISFGWGDSIRCWDVTDGKPVCRFVKHQVYGTLGAAFSPDGRTLASVGEQGRVRLWDFETRRLLIETVAHHQERVYGVVFSPDGTQFATAGGDTTVMLWDAESGAAIDQFEDDGAHDAHPVAFSPDGTVLATGSGQGRATIRIWNLAEKNDPLVINAAHQRDITSLVFLPDGQHLVSAGIGFERVGDRDDVTVSQIRVWDVKTGLQVGEFRTDEPLTGHCAVALSAEGRTLCSAHQDQIVAWDVRSGEPQRMIATEPGTFSGRTHGLAVSPDGTLVAAKGKGNCVELWDLATGMPVVPQGQASRDAVTGVSFSDDSQRIATSGSRISVWDAESNTFLRHLSDGPTPNGFLKFLPDSSQIVWASTAFEYNKAESTVTISQVSDGRVMQQYTLPDQIVSGDVSPDGTRLAVGTVPAAFAYESKSQPAVTLWNLSAAARLDEWKLVAKDVSDIRLFDQDSLIWTSADAVLHELTMDSASDTLAAAPIARHPAWQDSVIASDASFVVVGALLGLRTDEPYGVLTRTDRDEVENWHLEFQEHRPTVIAVSPNNQMIAVHMKRLHTSREPNRIDLRSAETGRQIRSFVLEDGSVRSMCFSPDGTRLVTGMDRGDTLIWDLSAVHREKAE